LIKYRVILSFFILTRVTSLNAQAYNPYSFYASLSYGFYSKGFQEFVNYSKSNEFTERFYNMYSSQAEIKGPISFKYEFNVANHLGLMPYIGYEQMYLTVLDCTKTTVNKFDFVLKSLSIAARANYHFNIKTKWFDPFIGLGFGATIYGYNRKINGEEPTNVYNPSLPGAYTERRFYLKSPTFISATIGFRLYFTPRLGFNIEAGWEKSALVYRIKGRDEV
jgi:hypothetical protein